MSRKLPYLLVTLLSSCSLLEIDEATMPYRFEHDTREEVQILDLQNEALASVKVPVIKPVVAVYPHLLQTKQAREKVIVALLCSLRP